MEIKADSFTAFQKKTDINESIFFSNGHVKDAKILFQKYSSILDNQQLEDAIILKTLNSLKIIARDISEEFVSLLFNFHIPMLLFNLLSHPNDDIHEATLCSINNLISQFKEFGKFFINSSIVPILKENIYSDNCEIAIQAMKALCNLSASFISEIEETIGTSFLQYLQFNCFSENLDGFEDPDFIDATLSLICNCIDIQNNYFLNLENELFNYLNHVIIVTKLPTLSPFKFTILKHVIQVVNNIFDAFNLINDYNFKQELFLSELKRKGIQIANDLIDFFSFDSEYSDNNSDSNSDNIFDNNHTYDKEKYHFCLAIIKLLFNSGPTLGNYCLFHFIPLFSLSPKIVYSSTNLISSFIEMNDFSNQSQESMKWVTGINDFIGYILKSFINSPISLKEEYYRLLLCLINKHLIDINLLMENGLTKLFGQLLEYGDEIFLQKLFPIFKDAINIAIASNMKEWGQFLKKYNIPNNLENLIESEDLTCAGYAKICLDLIQPLYSP